MDPLSRNNVRVSGNAGPTIVFSHGYGCDQNMWRYVAPAFADSHRVVLFDHVGAGESDLSAWNPDKYGSLDAYAQDIVEIGTALDLEDATFVGHSVSAMIGIMAAKRAPRMFARLVLVGPSPCYINDDGYVGGFDRVAIEELLEFMDANYLGWSNALAPQIVGNADRPELGEELTNSFCRTDPVIARHFARVTFLSDNRADLEGVTPDVLILQCSDDVIAPDAVGRYVQSRIPGSTLVQMQATGHCPNLSAPEETVAAIKAWL